MGVRIADSFLDPSLNMSQIKIGSVKCFELTRFILSMKNIDVK